MKTTGLEVIELGRGVNALRLTGVNLKLDFVAANHIINLECHRIGSGLALPETKSDDARQRPIPVKRLSVMKKGSRFRFTGLFGYRTHYELADYLVRHYLPADGTPLDSLIKRRKGSVMRKQLVCEVVEILEKSSDAEALSIRYENDQYQAWFPRLKQDADERSFNLKYFEVSGKRMLFRTTREPRFFELQGPNGPGENGIPSNSYLLMDSSGEDVVSWHGLKVEGMPFAQIDPDLLKRLDRRAKAMDGKNRPVLPRPGMRADFFLRVPSRAEAREHLKAPRRKTGKIRHPNPLFLFDLSETCRSNGSCRIVSNPKEALGILSRTRDRIYAPNDSYSSPEPHLREKPYFLAAVRVSDE